MPSNRSIMEDEDEYRRQLLQETSSAPRTPVKSYYGGMNAPRKLSTTIDVQEPGQDELTAMGIPTGEEFAESVTNLKPEELATDGPTDSHNTGSQFEESLKGLLSSKQYPQDEMVSVPTGGEDSSGPMADNVDAEEDPFDPNRRIFNDADLRDYAARQRATESATAAPGKKLNFDKASDALYAAQTGTAPRQLFRDTPGTKSDPLLDLKKKLLEARINKQSAPAAGKEAANPALVAALKARNPEYFEKLGPTDGVTADDVKIMAQMAGGDASLGLNKDKHAYNQSVQERKLTNYETQQKAVQDRYAGTQFGKYHDDIKDIVPMVGALKEVEKVAPGLTRGIVTPQTADALSEFNKAKLELPGGSQFTSQQAANLKSALGIMRQAFVRPLAGANLTEPEIADFRRILQDAWTSPPEVQAAAIDIIRGIMGSKLKITENNYRGGIIKDPQMWADFEAGQGLTSKDPIFAAPSERSMSTETPAVGSVVNRLASQVGISVPKPAAPKAAPPPAPLEKVGKDGRRYRKGPNGWEPVN